MIIDELKGRKIAKELGIEISGSLGVLITARNKGVIKKVKPLKETNFRLSDKWVQAVLNHVKED
ncbi:hypothetical protein C900_03401 [Fulvivirga imtechensis AK7]|uniref:DUF3368 domain-containing protein n=1 Tax=Fulvivirga imtechensis AK7 TaxID=1237149 RepID=L8JRJ5_9BACT|nr:DUF3368 domain-containing protein [Fulvivirga imtechensis]ELR70793.1 hypothetical protein C900_03401 [Fulvivirga imtechensis AK7]